MEEEWKGPDHGSHARCDGFVGRGAALRRGGAVGRGAVRGRGAAFGRAAALGRGGAFGRAAALGRGGAFGRGAALGRGGAFGRGAALGRGGAFGRGAALGRGGAFGRGAALGRGGAVGRGAALGRGGAVGRGAALGRGSGGRGVAGGGDVARGGGAAAAAGGGGAALGGRGRGATGGIAAAVVKGAVGGRAAALGRGEAVGKGTAGGRGAASERGGRGAIRGRGGAFGRGASAGRGSGGRGVAGGGDVARGGGAAARGGGVAVGGGGRGATGGRGIDGCSRGVAGEADATGSRGTARGRGAAGHGGAAGGRVSVGHGGAARGGDAGGGDAVGNRGAAGVGDAVGSEGGGERGKKGSGGRRGGGGAERAGSSGGNRKDGDAPGRHSRDEGRSPSAKRKDGSHRNAFKILHKLSGKNPSEVAITLSSISTLQDLLNDKEMRQDLVQLLCSVLCKAFQARRDRGTRRHLAGMVKDSEFLRFTLPHHVEKMASESCTVRRKQYTDHLDNILAVVFEVLKTFPNSSLQSLSMLVRVLPSSSRDLRVAGMNVLPETDEKLVEIQELVSLQKKSRESTSKPRWRPKNTGGENHGVEEQEDFRNLPICPTPEEMHEDQRPFLRPNLTSEPYASNHLYLDTHFRLLREDFVRPLREGIQQLLQRQMANDSSLRRKRLDDITVYRDTRLVEPVCTHVGVAYVVQFDPQPFKGVRWENSKRLIYGSLVCLSCDNFESFLYATVSDSEPRGLRKGRVQLIFTEESRDKLMAIQADRFLMVESTAFFEAYRHVLEGLQEQEEACLPFQRYIVDCNTDVLPPAYLKKRGDTYNMSSIVHPEHRSSIQPFHCLKPEAWPKKEVLGLDESQMRALQLALTNELAIIQGPPGTGKTYTGLKIAQALLTNEGLWSSGAPMLVVCFTNHALDQFLEGILKFLPKGIVRVGGRSNSEALKKFNLRELTHDLPWYLRSAKREIYRDLDEVKREIKPLVVRLGCSLKGILQESFLETFMLKEHRISLHRPFVPDQGGFEADGEKIIMEWLGIDSTVFQRRATEEAIGNGEGATAEDEEMLGIMEQAGWIQAERILEDFHPRFDRDEEMDTGVAGLEEQMLALNIDDTERQADPSDEGWEMQRQQRRKIRDRIRKELDLSSDMTEAEEKEVLDAWLLSLPDRWRLYRLWVARYRMALRSEALRPAEAYQHVVDRLADVQRSDRLCVLRKAKVIGMTTTGAAKSRELIQELQPRLVIVEEAAQVLEAHIITALAEDCEHLILIGDHQQLRPSATVYDLARKYDLEVSMFERLIKMNLPFVRLNSQHRMKPNIASLLTPHIYAELENHPSVMAHEDIMGLKTNLFFLEHNHHEEHMRDGKSHQNQHEATFVVALCRYLLLQDYEPEQITILTTYTAQLLCLGRLMKTEKSFAGVKVHTVDKYQGEENDIILLSLVRSNAEGKVGFLRISNRVCVALSRAKKALYCICNSEMLGGVELWAGIFGTLREKGEIGTALTLRCHNHPDREVEASCAEDFEQAPDGGCKLRCEFSLECGHPCALYCHPRDPEHKKYQCPEECARFLCDLKHGCPLRCHEPCPECMVMVEKTIPECQHKQMVPCHQDPKTFACWEPCQKMLQCGHNQMVPCHQDPETLACQEPCQKMLKCGHACTGTCYSCHQGRYHFACAQRCERLLICSHKCQEICAPDCSACRRPCENRCVHGNRTHPCGHPCTPCTEPCAWQCPHQRCSKRCHEPCDRPPCVQPCDKILDCGHPCIGLCGEKCPKRCRICDANVFGTEDADRTALYVQLEDCGHIVESTAIDSYMGMGDIQQSNEGEQVAIRLKDCPECQTPIRNNLRYGTQIKSILIEIEKVKMKLSVGQTDIAKKKKTLTKRWKMSGLQIAGYMNITAELNPRHLTMKDLCILENKMAFLEKVEKLKTIQKKHMSGEQGLFEGEIKRFVMWLLDLKQKFTGQQVSDLQRELKRLILFADHDIRCNLLVKEGATPGPFTEQDQVKQALKCLEDMIHERKAIVPAIQMTPGHWYRCPKGHVYVMSEGEGATESERCPDCEQTVTEASP